ncbi:radical SAM protein [bacterium]|nr:radical SAM protein [candidate division CSSED10-310 bacterium]
MSGVNLAGLYGRIGDLYSYLPMRLGAGYAFPPMRLALVLTHRCNLRCEMCNVWRNQTASRAREELSTAEVQRVIEATPCYAIITFTGGEPFLRDDIRDLLEFACRRRRVHLVTNGTLCTAADGRRLPDLSPRRIYGKGLLSLGVSLEGPEAVHDAMVGVPGSYRRSISLISAVAHGKRGRFPLVDVKVVMSRRTFPHLLDLYHAAAAAGADLVSFQIENTQVSAYGVEKGGERAHAHEPPPVEEVPAPEVTGMVRQLREAETSRTRIRFNPDIPVEELVNRYKNVFRREAFYCDTPWTVMHIGPYGDVFPCYSYPMGNVRNADLARIWNGPPYRAFRQAVATAKIFPGCAGCCVMKWNGR